MVGTSFAPTFWTVFFGSFFGFMLVYLWRFGHSRVLEEVSRGEGLVRIAEVVGGSVYFTAHYPRPFVVFEANGVLSFFHQWMLSPLQAVTTIESRVGFPGFLEATTHDSLRPPSLSPRFRALAEADGFAIITTDAGWAGDILGAGLREILGILRQENRRTRLTLAADRFAIEVEDRLIPLEVRTLVACMKRLAALSRVPALTAGVTILGEVVVADHGRCPVCRQAIAPPGIPCPVCRAPHHADCWQYWGRCAIFGCRGGIATSASRG